jgi:hypothetical protein
MDELQTPKLAPSGWLETQARSKARIATGESLALRPILDRLRAAAERLDHL